MSGFGAWLSQSSFLLMKCLVELVVPALLEPSLTSVAKNQTTDVKTFFGGNVLIKY